MKKITAMKLALGMGVGLGLCVCQPANAANWFNIQTISLPEWGSGQFIGFLQPLYTDIAASPVVVSGYPHAPANGQTAHFNEVAPMFDSSSQLYMQRARFFIRGSIGGNPDISYYVGAEAGQNGYDYSWGRYAPRVIDANMVFSHYIPGVRLEIGNIRAPGPEGAMEGFMDFNFLDAFGTGLQQLMQPTFYNNGVNYKLATAGTKDGYAVPGGDVSGNNGFRYPGIQAEDWFMVAPKVEVAYGAMLADYGKMLDSGTSNGPIVAGRLQASYLFGSEQGRFFRNDLTGFIWAQAAHPEIGVAPGQPSPSSSNMTRDGFGMTYRKGYMERGGLDVKAEYFEGSGNIVAPTVFNETPGMAAAPALYDEVVYAGSNNTANGYDLSAGYFLTKRIEAVLRYDYYDRLPNNAAAERMFKDTSLALEYHVTPLSRVVVDYIDRSITIPNPGAVGAAGSLALTQASAIVNSVGNQIDVWAVYAF
ncbi:MAG: porin [Betaproteobacteria bacterium]|nr:porin [Betaproteobacteria bacterium]